MLLFSASKFAKEDLKTLFQHFWWKLLGISVLIGFLLFLLNIFLWLGLYAHQFSGQLKDKLGMYFYIKETPWQEEQTYKDILLMKDELQSKGLKVMFSSKDDALAFLQKKIPDVVDNFQKFGISNPLPATLYVMFSSDSEYTILKTVILNHKDIILNVKDIDAGSTIKQQENRILTVINMSNFIVVSSYCIIWLILLVVLAFLGFLLKNIFSTLHKEFEVKKLLWANYLDVVQSFVMITLDILLVSFIICFALVVVTAIILDVYLNALFSISFLSLFNIFVVLGAIVAQVIVVVGSGVGLAYYFTSRLHHQLPIEK